MFDWNDLAVLGGIIGVNLVMSGDNAVIIALASQKLPADMKKKVMLLGSLAAVVLRVLFTAVAVTLLEMPYLQLTGGLVLIWISFKLMVNSEETGNCKQASCMLEAIKTILIADTIMSVDNVLALAAVARNSSHEYLFLMIGLGLSLPIVMFCASLVSRLLERFPIFIYVGSGILLYAAGELIVSEAFLAGTWINAHSSMFVALLTLTFLTLGYWQNLRTSRALSETSEEEELQPAEDHF